MAFNSAKTHNAHTVTAPSNHGDSNKLNGDISNPVTALYNDGQVSSTANSVKQTVRHS